MTARKKIVVTTAVLFTLAAGGVAVALWSATGTGSGQAQATTAVAAEIAAASGEPDLFPGFTDGDVFFTITNDNPYDIVTITNSGSNDIVTVTDSRCDLNVGSIATGRDYVTITSTFREPLLLGSDSRVLWTAATNTLTIHLGSQVSGLFSLVTQSPATVTYTPDQDLRDPSGRPIDTTPFTAANQRF